MRIKQMKVGDKVKVDRIGGFYSTYKDWAEIVGAERWVKNKYPENMEFVIKAIAPHLTESIMLYLLSNDEGDFIFDGIDSNITIVKPRTRTEYEKVAYSSAWKAAKDHEERKVELWRKSDLNEAIKGNNWKAIQSPSEAAQYHFDLYRKVEKEIDWREEVSNFVDDEYSYITIHENGAVDALLAESSNVNFLELCRVALRANGEIE